MLRRWIGLGLLCAAVWLSPAGAAKSLLGQDDVLWQGDAALTRDADAWSLELQDLIAAGQGDLLPALLDAEPDVARRQLAAASLLRALAAAPSQPSSTDSLLEWAARQPISLWSQHEETSSPWFMPAVDLAGLASGARILWHQQQERDAWRASMDEQSLAALDAIRRADAQGQQRAGEALAALPAETRDRVIALALADASNLRPEWWEEVVQVAPSPASIAQLWQSGASMHRVVAIRAAGALDDWAAAQSLLERFESDAELASAATMALVVRSAREPISDARRDALLMPRLADPKRAFSVASALTRVDPEVRIGTAQRLWSKHRAPESASSVRSALQAALELSGSDQDRDALRSLRHEETTR
ncbi:MAG: hypothetical protein KDJ14_13995 [Xanthomonadales bacterium]|nr:hypothetical protein [Xanthomonadales bacterium]